MDAFWVIPLKVVTTQALLLIVAIAIEAFVIQQQMQFSPRKSMEYSASLNLLSTVIGWLSFFALLGPFFLTDAMKLDVLNFFFFQRWGNNVFNWIIFLGVATFFGTVAMETLGFTLLQRALNEYQPLSEETPKNPKRSAMRTTLQPKKLMSEISGRSDVLYAILLGNALSYIVIVVLVVAIQIISN